MSLASDEAAAEKTMAELQKMTAETRIAAEPTVTVLPGGASVAEVIHEKSAHADVVFLGLAIPEEGRELAYAGRLATLAEGLDTVFFVKNSSLFTGELV